MTFPARIIPRGRDADLVSPRWRVCLGALLVVTASSCVRSELAAQLDEAKAALAAQQQELELLRKEGGQSGATTPQSSTQNWHLQELQKRLTEGKAVEADLVGQKAELEEALQKLEAVRSDYLKNHGGSKS